METVVAMEPAADSQAPPPPALEFRAVSCFVPVFGGGGASEAQVLHRVSGSVGRGTLHAVLGPSGSGKTTLVSAVAGRSSARVEGEILVGGRLLDKRLRRSVGYVPQINLQWPTLTCGETLYSAARLRLPRSLSAAAVRARCDEALATMRLQRVAGTIVGDYARRGLSGGEQKRVAIAVELVCKPSLLILDEPSSGLDASLARHLVDVLRDCCTDRNTTVVLTIHQPSGAMFGAFDTVQLLSSGRCIWLGPPGEAAGHFACLGRPIPPFVNPAEFLLDLASEGETDAAVLEAFAKPFQAALAPKPPLHRAAVSSHAPAEPRGGRWAARWRTQVAVLTRRNWLARYEDALFDRLKLAQILFIAVFAGLIWFGVGRKDPETLESVGDVGGLVFFSVLLLNFMSMFTSLLTFLAPEISIVRAERAAGWYRLSAFYTARCLADVPLEVINPLIFIPIVYWMSGLKATAGAFLAHLCFSILGVLVASSFGLLVGALTQNIKKAQTLASVVMLTVMLTGGFYVDGIPAWLTWTSKVSWISYTYAAQLKTQYPPGSTYVADDGEVLDTWGPGTPLPELILPGTDGLSEAGVLLAFLVVLRVLTFAVLRVTLRQSTGGAGT